MYHGERIGTPNLRLEMQRVLPCISGLSLVQTRFSVIHGGWWFIRQLDICFASLAVQQN